MQESYPDTDTDVSRLDKIRFSAKRALALTAMTGAAMLGANVEAGHASTEHQGEIGSYLKPEASGQSPIELARRSNRLEIALLKEIRQKKAPAAIFNGALRFHDETMMYLGPIAKKADRTPYDSNRNGDEFVLSYPMLVPRGNILWAATFNNHHSTVNIGQGSDYGSVAWIPLNEAKFAAYTNSWDGAPALMHFHEHYVAKPQGEGLSENAKPVWNISVNGNSSTLPRPEAIMDTDIGTTDEVSTYLQEVRFQLLPSWSTSKYRINIAKNFRK